MAPLSGMRGQSLQESGISINGIATTHVDKVGEGPYDPVRLATVTEGQTVLGALITQITQDSVEFEVDGKRWSQQVQQ